MLVIAEGRGSERPAPPLIVTLDMDERSFAVLDGLRRAHFPPERNFIPAHVTLFHHLPGGEEAAVSAALVEACGGSPAFEVQTAGVRLLGAGVAITLDSAALERLRGALAERWDPWLTPQDRQRFRPHVTIQNKVAPAQARALHERLGREFEPMRIQAVGLRLWRYLGGPWDLVRACPFGGEAPD